MRAKDSMVDSIRLDYRVYLEPVLAQAARSRAGKVGCRTLSKYIRYAIINQVLRDGYPLETVSQKFKPFCDRVLHKGVSYRK